MTNRYIPIELVIDKTDPKWADFYFTESNKSFEVYVDAAISCPESTIVHRERVTVINETYVTDGKSEAEAIEEMNKLLVSLRDAANNTHQEGLEDFVLIFQNRRDAQLSVTEDGIYKLNWRGAVTVIPDYCDSILSCFR